jgi:hypothetical protein
MSEQLNEGLFYGEDALERDIAEALASEKPCDFVTVLRSLGPPVTKRIYRDASGKLRKDSYQNAFLYSFTAGR